MKTRLWKSFCVKGTTRVEYFLNTVLFRISSSFLTIEGHTTLKLVVHCTTSESESWRDDVRIKIQTSKRPFLVSLNLVLNMILLKLNLFITFESNWSPSRWTLYSDRQKNAWITKLDVVLYIHQFRLQQKTNFWQHLHKRVNFSCTHKSNQSDVTNALEYIKNRFFSLYLEIFFL